MIHWVNSASFQGEITSWERSTLSSRRKVDPLINLLKNDKEAAAASFLSSDLQPVKPDLKPVSLNGVGSGPRHVAPSGHLWFLRGTSPPQHQPRTGGGSALSSFRGVNSSLRLIWAVWSPPKAHGHSWGTERPTDWWEGSSSASAAPQMLLPTGSSSLFQWGRELVSSSGS